MPERVFDKARCDLATDKLQELFDRMKLTLAERYHVCECYEMACLAAMDGHAREAAQRVRERDLESIRNA